MLRGIRAEDSEAFTLDAAFVGTDTLNKLFFFCTERTLHSNSVFTESAANTNGGYSTRQIIQSTEKLVEFGS